MADAHRMSAGRHPTPPLAGGSPSQAVAVDCYPSHKLLHRCNLTGWFWRTWWGVSKWFCDIFIGVVTGAASCDSFVRGGFGLLIASYE
jgi:hypothetical protein